jgi:hypothetical protein
MEYLGAKTVYIPQRFLDRGRVWGAVCESFFGDVRWLQRFLVQLRG